LATLPGVIEKEAISMEWAYQSECRQVVESVALRTGVIRTRSQTPKAKAGNAANRLIVLQLNYWLVALYAA